ncbi:UDP-N-acetylmuramate--L-alanine ligase [Beggiatoa leptomitoformis]|uniref:UDP-N-acetylmuramate--L-alanine ligase n=1 Tax=Beggiatoa leptomitoformis TaxID=288004 RepID=A0A2N9YCR5_9GAMM|nr:UDP-N-acetylmuramate--L-alanine ligase [Beggiatoa leptomitoformis]ALG66473.1 UDP-N-acetylmuramate--L-alanine ligase [Beggiatoa leptomitoformis]AUI68236.1 UDP-N-acetylmuramate--L-alanine ligase [Beggiatoa leptomitoformis]
MKMTHHPVNLPKRGRRIHFVGIGGAGMCGIAEVMHHVGYAVSGSDLHKSATTRHLSSLGIKLYCGHDANNIYGCDVVVISSAVKADNPEVVAARAQHIPVIPRAEMLGELMRFRQGIAIAGTHGKTTTTSLITSLLAEGNLDPTFVIGGKLNSVGRHANLGAGAYLVAEADESDASFLYLKPVMAVVTNIDADHLETYQNDFNKLQETFIKFLQQLPFYGLAVVCIDDPVIRQLLPQLTKPLLTYGTAEEAEIRAVQVQQIRDKTHFQVWRDNSYWMDVTLNLAGVHNVRNALAAIAIAHEVGVEDAAIQRGLQQFSGIGRRFQTQHLHTAQGNIMLIDDYGHHPREIEAVLQAIRAGWAERRLVVVFQPHRYTRTRDLFDDFVQVLSTIDVLLLLDVYAAGESRIEGADGQALCHALQTKGQVKPRFVAQADELVTLLPSLLQDQDILLTLGAGNIGTISANLPAQLTIQQSVNVEES